jgi:outer membrane receptor protein involved in Fe transport
MYRFVLPGIMLLGLWLVPTHLWAQEKLSGFVMEEDQKGKLNPLPAANVYWLGTQQGTTTNANGYFELALIPGIDRLVISYIGYDNDTLLISQSLEVKVILKNARNLSVVEISGSRASTYISTINPIRTQVMTEEELFKAACCNLSESFETNPAVDVSYSDAVTGVKQIQMLGLSGSYIQLQRENMPDVRGLSTHYGLNFIPGSWIESIQLTKGVGSVVNGYESISGQLNVELKKADTGDYVFANGYLNQMGRSEGNWYSRHRLNNQWTTAFLLHGNIQQRKNDVNKDGFLDIPLGNQWNVLNRWRYDNGKGWMAQLGIQALQDDRVGGQLAFDPENRSTNNAFGTRMQLARYVADAKLGYVFPKERYRSIGLQLKAIDHRSTGYFGQRNYNGNQQSLYGNLIYQDILFTTDWKYRAGFSWLYDDFDENFHQEAIWQRTEKVGGAFFEMTYSRLRWSIVGGLRYDYHNMFGGIWSPRLHAKYDLTENTQLRASAGRGFRTANPLMENIGGLVSNRQLQFVGDAGKYPFAPEIAWNYGLNFTHAFKWWRRDGQLALDYYFTDFEQQLVADYDQSPQLLAFYMLQGRSFSHSFQAELNLKPMRRTDVRLAYRWLDVRTDYQSGLLSRPLLSPHRWFVNAAYKTRNEWSFDFTAQWLSSKRLPSTASNPEAFRFPDYSPDYVLMNAQISKKLGRWDVYLGVENLGDFRQERLVNSSDNPALPYFDASLVWGPAVERMVYLGFRWRISPPTVD